MRIRKKGTGRFGKHGKSFDNSPNCAGQDLLVHRAAKVERKRPDIEVTVRSLLVSRVELTADVTTSDQA